MFVEIVFMGRVWIDRDMAAQREEGPEQEAEPDEVKSLKIPADAAPPPPLVVAPGGEATRGILVHDLSLVFPFGLFMIGLRFLVRAILTLSGHIPVDPDAAHKEDLPGARDKHTDELDPNTSVEAAAPGKAGGA